MSEPTVSVVDRDGVAVVSFSDQTALDAYNIEASKARLIDVVESQQPPNLIIDLANVMLLSSQALGFLVTLRLKAARGGVNVVLAGIRESLADIIRLTQLDKLYTIYASSDEAAARLAPS